MDWNYPICVIAHGGGYASVVDASEEGDERHSLIVVTDTDRSLEIMQRLGVMGAPRIIGNAREFRWLVESLQAPVTHVVFDIDPVEDNPNPRWSVSITELLEKHLVIDYSPWNYPVHVIAVENGFLSITGQREDFSTMNAIVVFRERARAEAYMSETGAGEICDLNSLEDAAHFFEAVADVVDAVALDPVVEDGQCRTKHCFSVQTLLEKYLIEPDSPGEQDESLRADSPEAE